MSTPGPASALRSPIPVAQARWRKFNGHELIADVLAGAVFKDGERIIEEDNDNSIDEKVAV